MNNTISFQGDEISPSKIVCIGRNYVDHIAELGNETPTEPVIFIKPNSSISNDVYTHKIDDIHYEAEICFLIFAGSIVGVGFGLDLTKRNVQSKLKEKGLPWERAKAFDKSAVFSEFVSVSHDISELKMELYINGLLRQNASYQLMINKPISLINEINSFMSLVDGDVVMSGTPSGVGEINNGDQFVGKIYNSQELLIECSWQAKNIE